MLLTYLFIYKKNANSDLIRLQITSSANTHKKFAKNYDSNNTDRSKKTIDLTFIRF